MARAVFRGIKQADRVACFYEPNQTGSKRDIDAPRNAPLKTPSEHLDKLVWHSSLFQYEIAGGPASVTINHTSLATQSKTWGVTYNGGAVLGGSNPGGVSYTVLGAVRVTDILLLTHNLGYAPKAMVAFEGRRIPTGYEIQHVSASGGSRQVCAFSTSTGIYLRETAIAGSTTLPAISLTYSVMAFRTRSPDPAQPLFGKVDGVLVLARGIINTARRYLRRVGVGDSPFSLNLGRTIDIDNGFMRTASGGVVVTEAGYGGSMPAPAFVQVGV